MSCNLLARVAQRAAPCPSLRVCATAPAAPAAAAVCGRRTSRVEQAALLIVSINIIIQAGWGACGVQQAPLIGARPPAILPILAAAAAAAITAACQVCAPRRRRGLPVPARLQRGAAQAPEAGGLQALPHRCKLPAQVLPAAAVGALPGVACGRSRSSNATRVGWERQAECESGELGSGHLHLCVC